MCGRTAKLILAGGIIVWILSIVTLLQAYRQHSQQPSPQVTMAVPVSGVSNSTILGWLSPEQVFAGIGKPKLLDNGMYYWESENKRMAIGASRKEVLAEFDDRDDGMTDKESLRNALDILVTAMKLADNCLPEWSGAGRSVCSSVGAVRKGTIVNLYHEDRHVYIQKDGKTSVLITPWDPKSSIE